MKWKLMLSLALVFTLHSAFAAHNYQRSFTVSFTTGKTYEVSISGNTLTWKGVSGSDRDMVQTVTVKHIALEKNIDIFQWQEKRGYFVTFIVDFNKNKAVTSTKTIENQDWLTEGEIRSLK